MKFKPSITVDVSYDPYFYPEYDMKLIVIAERHGFNGEAGGDLGFNIRNISFEFFSLKNAYCFANNVFRLKGVSNIVSYCQVHRLDSI